MIDGRLLVPAVGGWLGAVGVTVLGGRVALLDRYAWAGTVLVVVAALTVMGTLTLGASLLKNWRPGRRGQLAMALVGGLILGCCTSALHIRALNPPLLSTWANSRVIATVEGLIVSPPIMRTSRSPLPWAPASRTEVRVSSRQVRARGQLVEVSVPMIVRLPSGLPIPAVGTTIRVTGKLGQATSSDAAATVTLPAADASMVVMAEPGLVDRAADAMRSGLRQSLRGTDRDSAALVAGLSIGDESEQSAELRAAMQASGLSHLTAVSGGNVAIVVVAVLGVAAALRAALLVRALAALVGLAFFVILVGPAPSVMRAAVMAGLVLVGMVVGGRRAGPSVLAVAVLVLVVLAPGLVASWGFALSAFATGGLILMSGPIADRLARRRRFGRLPPAVREALSVTLAAQLATAPVLLAMGAPVGWVSLPANLLAMPVVAPVTVLGLLAAMLAPLAPAMATVLAQLASWPAGWIVRVAFSCVQLPGARVPWPEGLAGVVTFVVAVAAALVLRAIVRRVYPTGVPSAVRGGGAALALLVVVGWVVFPPDRRSWPPPGWLMIMCDVGQGDGLVLRSAPDQAVVVDVGPDPDAIDRCLRDARVTVLPAVVLTHFHADHVNGLAGALRGRAVGTVLATPIRDPPEEAQFVDRVLGERNIVVSPMSAGDTRTVGDIAWRAVWPRRRIATGSVPNNASVVLIVETHQRRLLLMGDVEPEAQAAVATDIAGVRFDVVKVPHHGSRYQHPLLTTWAPAPVALVSVGAGNDYGHPAPATVAAWRAIGAVVARTDEVGDVAIVTSPSGIEVVPRHGMLQAS